MVDLAETECGSPLPKLHHVPHSERLVKALIEPLRPLCAELLKELAGKDAYIQGTPNIRLHRPGDRNSVIPFHSDVLYGHSPEERNYWINLTPVHGTNSLWMTSEAETEQLHHALRYDRLSLDEFQVLAKETAKPIEDPLPGIHSFCCAQVHGSVLNETDSSRVSLDLRVLGPGSRANVKRRGGYFRPQWLSQFRCPLKPETPVTTVASLDEPTPVYLQRMAMEKFYPQGEHLELVEYHGLPHHSPHLTDALASGPVLAYTVRQLKGVVPQLTHPIGFVDERIWITADNLDELARLIEETREEPRTQTA